MVVAPIAVIGLVVLGFFLFKDTIFNALTGGLATPTKAITGGLEGIGGSIFGAGEEAGRVEAERQRKEQIVRAEADIEKAARDQGFSSVEEFNRVSDSGSIVIGGERTIVDFGLIGDVIPTNPSREFIGSVEGRRLIETNPEFAKIVREQQGITFDPTRAKARFGGQTQ